MLLETDSCLLLRTGQLLYGPIIVCPAGEHKPGKKSNRSLQFFPESRAVLTLRLKVGLTAEKSFFLFW